MTSTETSEALALGERYEPGQLCGACRFPVKFTAVSEDGTTEEQVGICGNPVYAHHGKGALPKYCGQAGQEVYQEQHGTPGDVGHRAELAGYPRRVLGLGTKEAAAMAAARAVELGVAPRAPRPTPSPEAVAAVAEPSEAEDQEEAPVRVDAHARTEEAEEPEGDEGQAQEPAKKDAFARLAEVLLAGMELAAELGDEAEAVRVEHEDKVAGIERRAAEAVEAAYAAQREAEQRADEAEATAAAKVAEAEAAVEAAHAARLRAEGARDSAERRLDEAEARRVEEAKRADRESARADRILEQFANVRREREEEWETGEWTPRDETLAEMRKRVKRGHIDRRSVRDSNGTEAPTWHIGNAISTRPAARTLDWMAAHGHLVVADDGAVRLADPETARKVLTRIAEDARFTRTEVEELRTALAQWVEIGAAHETADEFISAVDEFNDCAEQWTEAEGQEERAEAREALTGAAQDVLDHMADIEAFVKGKD